mgnify:CR=1 FL=1
MKKIYKILIQIIYFIIGAAVVVGCYFLAEGLIPKPWPGILCALAALLINETLGRYLLWKLWGISRSGIFDYRRKR